MFREDGTEIGLNEISKKEYVVEAFIQYLNMSGRINLRNVRTNEIISVTLAAWNVVQDVATNFNIRPAYQY